MTGMLGSGAPPAAPLCVKFAGQRSPLGNANIFMGRHEPAHSSACAGSEASGEVPSDKLCIDD